jgi:Cu/Ag efflux protein CusF
LNISRQILIVAILFLGACARKQESAEPARHYTLTGRILALNIKDQTATVDAAAIPGFMEAMTMEYPIKSKADFDKLHTGEKITATVEVRDGGLYDLSNVQRQVSATPK